MLVGMRESAAVRPAVKAVLANRMKRKWLIRGILMIRWIRSDEQVVQSRYLNMLENELAYYRDKFESERSRGDRLSDGLLIRNGELPVTDLVKGDQAKAVQDSKEEFDKRQKELAEIYGEAMAETEADGLELPEELQEEAKKLTEPA